MKVFFGFIIAVIFICVVAEDSLTIPLRVPIMPRNMVRTVSIEEDFPMQVGDRWEYEIKVVTKTAVMHAFQFEEVLQEPGRTIRVFQRKEILAEKAGKTFSLIISVKREATFGRWKGVELEIEEDTLGIFKGSKQVLWVIRENPRAVLQVVIYPKDDMKSVATQKILFAEEPVEIELAGVSESFLICKCENTSPHFVRLIKPIEGDGLKELFYYKKGIGLVAFVQMINDEATITFELISVRPNQ